MRRKRRAVKNHKRARYSTRSKSNSNISEGSTQSLIPKISNIEENVGAINDVRLEQTHSQLGNEAGIYLIFSPYLFSTNIYRLCIYLSVHI